MPKLVTNVEGTKVGVLDMRTQINQIMNALRLDKTVTFSFRMTVEEYEASKDAKP